MPEELLERIDQLRDGMKRSPFVADALSRAFSSGTGYIEVKPKPPGAKR